MRRVRLALVIVGMLTVFTVAVTAATAVAQETTLPNDGTTTVATTTVEPTTTTTEEPATTTTEAATTTTSSSTTTTTVAPAATSSDDDNTWVWWLVIGIVLLVAAAAITALVVSRRNAKRDTAEWTDSAASALRDADLTRDMLAGEARPGQPEEIARVAAVRDNVDRVSANFDQLAASAPTEDMRRNAIAVGASLRGYFFALEAEQLLHGAPTPPTGEQLAAADATKRTRATELDAAVNAIRGYLQPDPNRT